MRSSIAATLLLFAVAADASTSVTINGSTYSITDHPRIFLDGPGGTITTRVKDPDGAGPLVAPQATDSNPAFVGLKARVRTCVASSPPTCSLTEQSIVAMAALDWYMDNSQTNSLAAAKYWLNNPELLWAAGGLHPQYAIDHGDTEMGWGDGGTQTSNPMYAIAEAYTLIRDQLTAGEKTTLTQKMFNDVDDHGEDSGCTQQMQLYGSAVANSTSGSTTVTGSGFTGLVAGDILYMKTNALSSIGGWGTVQSVTGDTSITLVAAPKYGQGSNFPTTSSMVLYKVATWSSSTCGFIWATTHHGWIPRARSISGVTTTNVGSMTAAQTSMVVTSAAGLPTAPFYGRFVGGEIFLVTNVAGTTLTITRAQMLTTAATHATLQSLVFSKYIPASGTTDMNHNLAIMKIAPTVAMALAFADDSTNAKDILDRYVSDYITYIVPRNKDLWAGPQQAGSTNYGEGVQIAHNVQLVNMLKLITGSPSLDYSGGNWLSNVLYFKLYGTLPNAYTSFVPWGQEDIASDAVAYRSMLWAPSYSYIYGATATETKYYAYWERTLSGWFTGAKLSESDSSRQNFYQLLYYLPADTSTDYRAVLPLQRVFSTPDGDQSKSLQAWISRTSWSDTAATFLHMQAYANSYTSDHIGQGGPGGYKIYKNGWTLTEDAGTAPAGNTGQGYNAGASAYHVNMPYIGTAAPGLLTTKVITIDRTKSDAATGAYSYVRVNYQPGYVTANAVTRALRSVVHFKKTGTQDYVVAYDDIATSSGKQKTIHLAFAKAGAGVITDDTPPSLTYAGTSKSLTTRVVLPATNFAVTSSNAQVSRVAICASLDSATCDATNTATEFLLVHRPVASASNTMPTVGLLGTIDANFRGVQIEGTDPKVAIFPKLGAAQAGTTFTTTHTGTAQILVTGLSAGTYTLARDGTPVCSSVTVDTNEALYCETTAGAITVTAGAAPPEPIIVADSPLVDGTVGSAYTKTFTSTGGTGTGKVWTCTVTCATVLPPGLSLSSGGVLSGTPTRSGSYNFTIRVTDDGANTGTRDFALTIVSDPTGLVLTGTVNTAQTAALFTYGGAGLAADASCSIELSFAGAILTTYTSTSGSGRRVQAIEGLSLESTYGLRVDCTGAQTLNVSFTTLPYAVSSGSTVLAFKAPTLPGTVARVTVDWGLIGGSITDHTTTNTSCSNTCTVTLSLTAGTVVQLRHIWKDASGVELARSLTRYFVVQGQTP